MAAKAERKAQRQVAQLQLEKDQQEAKRRRLEQVAAKKDAAQQQQEARWEQMMQETRGKLQQISDVLAERAPFKEAEITWLRSEVVRLGAKAGVFQEHSDHLQISVKALTAKNEKLKTKLEQASADAKANLQQLAEVNLRVASADHAAKTHLAEASAARQAAQEALAAATAAEGARRASQDRVNFLEEAGWEMLGVCNCTQLCLDPT
jgi:hypothetical protein